MATLTIRVNSIIAQHKIPSIIRQNRTMIEKHYTLEIRDSLNSPNFITYLLFCI